MSALPADSRLRVVRTFVDPPYVIIQTEGRIGDAGVFFDLFRFADGLIVEQWGFSDKADLPNLSGHTQNDGPTEVQTDQDSAANKMLIQDYYEVVHIEGRHDRIPTYVSDRCIRHEPGVGDGMAAFMTDLSAATRHGRRSRSIDEIRLLLGQGDFVFIAATGTIETQPCVFVDLYRVEDGKIDEHWGFPQMIPPSAQRKNANGLA